MEPAHFNSVDCAMPSCQIKGVSCCVCCHQRFCDWHGRDYLKMTMVGKLCGDCMYLLTRELIKLKF